MVFETNNFEIPDFMSLSKHIHTFTQKTHKMKDHTLKL